MKKNYYGSLCTEMYEILHKDAPQDELSFYLSYANKNDLILEPLCGSGRFLIPFLQKGYNVSGIDLSAEMLAKLKEKNSDAKVCCCDILDYNTAQKYDYIFISSGSVSLFTDMEQCKKILHKIKNLLKKGGKFVFAVDTVADKCSDDNDYKVVKSVKTSEGYDLVLKCKNYFDVKSSTQYSPSIYELYDGNNLLQREKMDFQTHLYQLGEIEPYLYSIGFTKVFVYSSYDRKTAADNNSDIFLFECS